ncbi:phosphatidylethanolamine N-methyltransferase family protein [Candidatus Borrarchaeum sp.]|uniref:methyltransferase family protein n=1 Tax=Candidatus Borrarchaeum sp. TaxID=2846742 RepID=UPI00257F929E|nr:phosphatidylethanolamine N-methyltransferase family protein [Candidatus Borrarchaeum sp.]
MIELNLKLGLYNLWIFLVVGYGLIWALMILTDRKRGSPIEDPDFYESPSGKKCGLISRIFLLVILIISILTPINIGPLFWLGLPVYIIGIVLNVIAMYSFAQFTKGVNTTGIYRYSRNPMYLGASLFYLALCLMGWTLSVSGILLLVILIWWIILSHKAVLLEESFLEKKYGESFLRYKQRVPRYFLFI